MCSRTHNEDKTSWGIHINHLNNMASQPCPQWAKGVGQLVWNRLGIVIWDRTACKVYCLSPYQALDVLDDLRESSDWKENLFYLSWDSYSMPLSEENRKAWRGTKNRRSISVKGQSTPNSVMLTPDRTQELLLFLENHEDEIRALGDAYTKDVKRTLGRVYGFLINLGRERLQRINGSN